MLPSPTPLWQAPFSDVLEARAGQHLSGAWRLLLLGDGSPTRHFQLLTGDPVSIELIAMAPEPALEASTEGGDRADGANRERPPEVAELAGPLLRRQVWLRCGERRLAWAESWWNRDAAEHHLRDRSQPIWKSLTSRRAELFREVDGLALVTAPWLSEGFGQEGPFWSRHYRFFRGGRELTVIREVFSPALERWLGPTATLPHDD
ncbi:DUF98 domain-containing protein [Synechococcus sp. RSCCF101]|nr:DUF98 domain-containing protein [Synechococcus sp. RSCCF101]